MAPSSFLLTVSSARGALTQLIGNLFYFCACPPPSLPTEKAIKLVFTRVGGCNLSFARLILSSGPTSSLLCLGWDGRFAYSVKTELRKVGVIWFQASTLYTQLWGPGCTEVGWWVGESCLPGRCPCRVLSPVPIGQVRTPPLTRLGHIWRPGQGSAGLQCLLIMPFSAYSFQWHPSAPPTMFLSHLVLSPSAESNTCLGFQLLTMPWSLCRLLQN